MRWDAFDSSRPKRLQFASIAKVPTQLTTKVVHFIGMKSDQTSSNQHGRTFAQACHSTHTRHRFNSENWLTHYVNSAANHKYHELHTFLDYHKIDILLVTETKFAPNIYFFMPGYNIIRAVHPTNRRRGGSALFVKVWLSTKYCQGSSRKKHKLLGSLFI